MKRPPAALLKATREALNQEAVRTARCSLRFDGLSGLPPAWLPKALRQQFVQARDSLLDAHPEEQVRTWIADYPKRLKPFSGVRRVTYLPPESVRALDVVTRVRRIVRLGAKEGSRALLGDDAFDLLTRRAVKTSEQVRQSAGGRKSTAVRQQKANLRDEQIRAEYAQGKPVKKIVADLRVSDSTVRRALNRRS